MRRTLALAVVLGAAWAAVAAADGGGPSPGPSFGPPGVVDHARGIRYVTLLAGNSTLVEAVSTHGGRILRWTTVRGTLGLPMVAWDGSMGGRLGMANTSCSRRPSLRARLASSCSMPGR